MKIEIKEGWENIAKGSRQNYVQSWLNDNTNNNGKDNNKDNIVNAR